MKRDACDRKAHLRSADGDESKWDRGILNCDLNQVDNGYLLIFSITLIKAIYDDEERLWFVLKPEKR